MHARNLHFASGVSCFLFGPRGTGKTFWLRRCFPGATFVDLLAARTFNQLAADPQRLAGFLPVSTEHPVVIDEIQKIPALLDEVHRLLETERHWFILTGSSARKLRRSGVNLLGGRAAIRHMHPLTAGELGAAFDLGRALRFGLLPSLYDEAKTVMPEDYLQSYVQTYLKEEVMQEGLTRNLGAFSRFLEAASFSQGQLLNISEVARECQIKRKLAESYFDILEDLLIGVRLPSFERRARRRITQHPKFFFFDTGVFRAIRPTGPLDSAEEVDGAALETLVLQHLRSVVDSHQSRYSLYYWRTATGLEVDFVLYGPDGLWALEVKRKRNLSARDLTGLRAFLADYPEAKGRILYGGERRERMGDIEAIPIGEALTSLDELLKSSERGQ